MPRKIENEAELVKKALYDDEAFCALYDYYYPKVYNYMCFRLGHIYDAEDLTSTVFEKLIKGLSTYDDRKGYFSTWLFTIAGNVLKDRYRELSRKPELVTEELEEAASCDCFVENSIIQNDIKRQLLQATKSLDDRERNIISLKFWAGITNKEIAALLNLGESNVAVILFRAMKKLRLLLSNEEVLKNV